MSYYFTPESDLHLKGQKQQMPVEMCWECKLC